MGIATAELTPMEQTAFLTEYARALDSQWPRPILGDRLAYDVVGKIDYDFAGLGVQSSVACQTALRAKMLDDRVRAFVAEHPDAVVVDLGAGLDSGFYRVDPPPSVDWYSVDLPGITALRDQVLPANAHSHSVPISLADEALARRHSGRAPDHAHRRRAVRIPVRAGDRRDLPPHHRPLRLRRTGVQRLRPYRLRSAGWRSSSTRRRCSRTSEANGATPGFKDAHHPETWNPRMKLVEEASLAHQPEVDLFPPWIGVPTKLMGKTESGARKARILRYAF